jgi:hypothetical protein
VSHIITSSIYLDWHYRVVPNPMLEEAKKCYLYDDDANACAHQSGFKLQRA